MRIRLIIQRNQLWKIELQKGFPVVTARHLYFIFNSFEKNYRDALAYRTRRLILFPSFVQCCASLIICFTNPRFNLSSYTWLCTPTLVTTGRDLNTQPTSYLSFNSDLPSYVYTCSAMPCNHASKHFIQTPASFTEPTGLQHQASLTAERGSTVAVLALQLH